MHWRKATPTTEMTMGLKIAAAVQKRNCSGQLTSNFCSAFSSCQKCHSGFRNNQEKSKEWKIKYYLPSVLLEERERATARRIRGVEWHTWMRKKGWGRDKRVLEGLSKDVHEKMKWERGSNSLKSRRQTLKLLASEIKPFQRVCAGPNNDNTSCWRTLWLRRIQNSNWTNERWVINPDLWAPGSSVGRYNLIF